MSTAPRNTDEIKAVKDPAERARAVAGYLARLDEKRSEATDLRRQAIADLLQANNRHDWNRPAVIAKACEVSVSTVKAVRASLG